MKKAFLYIFCLIIGFPLLAQTDKEWIIDGLTDTLKFEFKVSTLHGKLALLKSDPVHHSPFHSKIIDFDLAQSDIKFLAFPFDKKGGKSDLNILGIRRNTEKELESFVEDNIDFQFSNTKKEGVSYTILDVTEDFLELDETYSIEIERTFYTDFNPDIPLRKMGFIWDTGPIAIAAGGLLWANSLNNQKKQALQDYRNLWQEGGLQSAAQGFYNIAETKRKDALKVIGISIAGAFVFEGLVWYFRSKRNKRIKLQKQINQHLF